MNEKEAKISVDINSPDKTNEQARLNEWWKAKGYLEAIEKAKPLVEQLKKVIFWCEGVKEKQFNLLVKGQNLESACKNWEEATTLDEPLEWGSIKKILEQWEKDK